MKVHVYRTYSAMIEVPDTVVSGLNGQAELKREIVAYLDKHKAWPDASACEEIESELEIEVDLSEYLGALHPEERE